MTPTTWTLSIPGWTPTPLNQFVSKHWAVAKRLKDADKAIMHNAMMAYAVPAASSKRRVELLIIHPKGKRFCDKDSQSKSLLDSMVHCGLLKNDSHVWLDMEKPEYARGEVLRTVITVTDL